MKTVGPPYSGKLNVRWDEKGMIGRLTIAPSHSFTLDFVVCFQYRADALKFQAALVKRLGKFGLLLEPSKTRLVEFGRFAQKHAKERNKKIETIYFLGFTHYCSRNRKVGLTQA